MEALDFSVQIFLCSSENDFKFGEETYIFSMYFFKILNIMATLQGYLLCFISNNTQVLGKDFKNVPISVNFGIQPGLTHGHLQ